MTLRLRLIVLLKVATSAADPPEKFVWFNVRFKSFNVHLVESTKYVAQC